MKLATLNDGSRDGKLIVVSRDLTRYAPAAHIAPTLQAALDSWETAAPRLEDPVGALNSGDIGGAPFDQTAAHSPLPRAYQWADGSAYVNHVALVRQARGAEMPESFWTDPLMYQGGSDDFLPPRAPIPLVGRGLGPGYGSRGGGDHRRCADGRVRSRCRRQHSPGDAGQ